MDFENIKPKYRITLKKDDNFFGPGVSTLLNKIKEYSSIQFACKDMGIAYSKAWKMINYAEQQLGFKLITTKSGGVYGGDSRLTEECEEFLHRYDSAVTEMNDITKQVFDKHFNDFKEIYNEENE